MFPPQAALWRRSLLQLRERGEPVGVGDLARRLLALRDAVEPALARRLVATALGRSAASLPDPLDAHHLRTAEDAAVSAIPLAEAAFTVVDLETTGLSPDRCAILEIGAVRIERLRYGDAFTTLIRPAGPVPPAISKLTGIVDEMVVDAPTPRRALRRFRRWLARTPTAPFVAHNANFDARFVSRALADYAMPPHRVPVLCTQRLARRLLPRLGRYNLDHLCAHFGITNRARHRADGDADATARAWIELLEVARADGRAATVGDLLDLQERPVRRRRRRRT